MFWPLPPFFSLWEWSFLTIHAFSQAVLLSTVWHFQQKEQKKIYLKASCTCKCCRRSFIHSKHNFHSLPFLGFSCYGVKNPAMLWSSSMGLHINCFPVTSNQLQSSVKELCCSSKPPVLEACPQIKTRGVFPSQVMLQMPGAKALSLISREDFQRWWDGFGW